MKSDLCTGTTSGTFLLELMVLWVYLMEAFGFDESDVERELRDSGWFPVPRGWLLRGLTHDSPVPWNIGDINQAFWWAAENALERDSRL